MEQNVQRTEEYMKLNKSIQSCTNASQLEGLRELVLTYHREEKQDSAELMANFVERENQLQVNSI